MSSTGYGIWVDSNLRIEISKSGPQQVVLQPVATPAAAEAERTNPREELWPPVNSLVRDTFLVSVHSTGDQSRES
nr:hypothetical protein [Tanacetum cinerariifolium]